MFNDPVHDFILCVCCWWWWWCLLSHYWKSGEPRMLHADPWAWMHNIRLGAFLCRWTGDRTSHRKASNPPSRNWIRVDSVRALHPIQQCHFRHHNPRNSTCAPLHHFSGYRMSMNIYTQENINCADWSREHMLVKPMYFYPALNKLTQWKQY